MRVHCLRIPEFCAPRSAGRPSGSLDKVELSPAVRWSRADKKALKERFKKLDTRSLEEEDSRKEAWRQLERQEALGKTAREAGDFIERIARSASSKGLISFYYQRFWEDLEALDLQHDERRDHYLGMLEHLFGDQAERRSRWDLIDRSSCGQPWAERALTMGALLEGVSLRGLSRVEDCCRAFGCWESAVSQGADPASARRIITRRADALVSGNWFDRDQLSGDFEELTRNVTSLARLPRELQAAVARSVEEGVSPEVFAAVADHQHAEPAARLLPLLSRHEEEDALGWLETFEALAATGLDPVAASFVVQEHLRKNEGLAAPKDPAAEAARLKSEMAAALDLPRPAPNPGVQVGDQSVVVGPVKLPVRRREPEPAASERPGPTPARATPR
ncbi:MAG: hypothetical protein AMXMBFR33_72880 [Candidatus Xenobia bacterium]